LLASCQSTRLILPLEITWRVTFVGSAVSDKHDEILAELEVAPLNAGPSKYDLVCAAPKASNVPIFDLVGITVLIVSGSYHDQEFCRAVFFVNVEDPEGTVTQKTEPADEEVYVLDSHEDRSVDEEESEGTDDEEKILESESEAYSSSEEKPEVPAVGTRRPAPATLESDRPTKRRKLHPEIEASIRGRLMISFPNHSEPRIARPAIDWGLSSSEDCSSDA
jgi:hypothetical protein